MRSLSGTAAPASGRSLGCRLRLIPNSLFRVRIRRLVGRKGRQDPATVNGKFGNLTAASLGAPKHVWIRQLGNRQQCGHCIRSSKARPGPEILLRQLAGTGKCCIHRTTVDAEQSRLRESRRPWCFKNMAQSKIWTFSH